MSTTLARTATLLLCLPAAFALQAGGAASTGAPAGKANEIVGTWRVQGLTGPCANPAVRFPIDAIVMFNAGGTLNMLGPGNPLASSPGLGTWSYDPATKRYSKQFRFHWFDNGEYIGYQQIGPMAFDLAPDGQTWTGVVQAERWVYDPVSDTHFKAFDACGEESAVRLP